MFNQKSKVMNTNELYKWLGSKVVALIVAYADHNNIKFSTTLANDYYKETAAERLPAIIRSVKEQQKEVDDSIFGGSKTFSKKAFEVNLIYELTEYAKEIVNHSLVEV